MHLSLGRAHEEVVKLGASLSAEARPRATCAVCLVQDSAAYWAHVGDSRIYQLRQAQVLERTRDHSHVEVLLREGLITEAEVHGHPMRNYVECCLGGDAALPEMTISARRKLKAGDVLLLCTDGVVIVRTESEQATLPRGQAVFIAAGQPVTLEGRATVFRGRVQ